MDSVVDFITNYPITIYMVVLAVYLGLELISKVPTVLHTPLMSGANAISGVVIIGAILLMRQAEAGDYLALFSDTSVTVESEL